MARLPAHDFIAPLLCPNQIASSLEENGLAAMLAVRDAYIVVVDTLHVKNAFTRFERFGTNLASH